MRKDEAHRGGVGHSHITIAYVATESLNPLLDHSGVGTHNVGMFLKARIRKYLRRTAVTLIRQYGRSETYNGAQIAQTIQTNKDPASFRSFLYALFGDEKTFIAISSADYKSVRLHLVTEILGQSPDVLSEGLKLEDLLDLKSYRSSRFHTPIGINRDAFWGSGPPS